MQRVEVRRRIDGSPQDVWDVYTDHVAWGDWGGLGPVRLERQGEPPPGGTGCVRVVGHAPLAAVEEILSFEPPKRMTYRIVRGGLPMRDHFGEVELEPDGEGTRITWRCRFESRIPGLGGLMRFAVERVFGRVLDGMVREHFPGS